MKMDIFNRTYHLQLGSQDTGELYYEGDTANNEWVSTIPSRFDSRGRALSIYGYLVCIAYGPKRDEHFSIRMEL